MERSICHEETIYVYYSGVGSIKRRGGVGTQEAGTGGMWWSSVEREKQLKKNHHPLIRVTSSKETL